ncbi:MAG: ribose-5-phosphate isomerase RpiA [Alphaproteobacteria bacterium]
MSLSEDDQKRLAALAALSEVRDGMVLGLGTGTVAAHFIRALGALCTEKGWCIRGVPTSEATAALARDVGIPLTDLDREERLALTVDGADEIGPGLALIKGGGGALLREKIVAAASDRVIIVAQGKKAVDRLGAFPLPVEIVPFGAASTLRQVRAALETAGLDDAPVCPRMKPDNEPFVTDSGMHIYDCACGAIPDPAALARALKAIPGVIDHGLFIGLSHLALIADETGQVRRLTG